MNLKDILKIKITILQFFKKNKFKCSCREKKDIDLIEKLKKNKKSYKIQIYMKLIKFIG